MSYLLDVTKRFDTNRLMSVEYWNGSLFSVNEHIVSIEPNGYIYTDLELNALYSSSYRKLEIEYRPEVDTASNYTNMNGLVVEINYYYSKDTKNCVQHSIIPITALNSDGPHDDSYFTCAKILPFPEIDASIIRVTIKNNTSNTASIKLCTLEQSYDVQTSQVANTINYSIGLKSIDVFNNGCLIKYAGSSESLTLEWQGDEHGRFNGVLVNESLFIPVTTYDSDL